MPSKSTCGLFALLVGATAAEEFNTVTSAIKCNFQPCSYGNIIFTVQPGNDYSVTVSPSSLMEPVYTDGVLSWRGLEDLNKYKGEASVVVKLPKDKLKEVKNGGSSTVSVWDGFSFPTGLSVANEGSGTTQIQATSSALDRQSLVVKNSGSGTLSADFEAGGAISQLDASNLGSGTLQLSVPASISALVAGKGSGSTYVNFPPGSSSPVTVSNFGSGEVKLCNPSSVEGKLQASGDIEVFPNTVDTSKIDHKWASGEVDTSNKQCPTFYFDNTITVKYQPPVIYSF